MDSQTFVDPVTRVPNVSFEPNFKLSESAKFVESEQARSIRHAEIGNRIRVDGGLRDLAAARDSDMQTQIITTLVGKKTLVVNLADLPCAALTTPLVQTKFTPGQIRMRGDYLQGQVARVFGDDREDWDLFSWNNAADTDRPSLNYVRSQNDPPPSLLDKRFMGAYWKQAPIILAPNRNWSVAEEWSRLTGIAADDLTCPRGDGIKLFLLLRQVSSALQMTNGSAVFDRGWAATYDADMGALDLMKRLSRDGATSPRQADDLVATAYAIEDARCLREFYRDTRDDYWSNWSNKIPVAHRADIVLPKDVMRRRAAIMQVLASERGGRARGTRDHLVRRAAERFVDAARNLCPKYLERPVMPVRSPISIPTPADALEIA